MVSLMMETCSVVGVSSQICASVMCCMATNFLLVGGKDARCKEWRQQQHWRCGVFRTAQKHKPLGKGLRRYCSIREVEGIGVEGKWKALQ
jgi:hypothetical protein